MAYSAFGMAQDFLGTPIGAQPNQSSFRNGRSGEPPVMPIAIIGMGCRLPGTATSPDGLWNMLSKGMSGWSRGSGSRFKMEAFYHPATEMNGSVRRATHHRIRIILTIILTVQHEGFISPPAGHHSFRQPFLQYKPHRGESHRPTAEDYARGGI